MTDTNNENANAFGIDLTKHHLYVAKIFDESKKRWKIVWFYFKFARHDMPDRVNETKKW